MVIVFSFVWSTLFTRDNAVWIELMHFALKYYSIWIWLNKQVSEWINEWMNLLSAEDVSCVNDHCVAARKQNWLQLFSPPDGFYTLL